MIKFGMQVAWVRYGAIVGTVRVSWKYVWELGIQRTILNQIDAASSFDTTATTDVVLCT
jgi:uncharacterized membrane protein